MTRRFRLAIQPRPRCRALLAVVASVLVWACDAPSAPQGVGALSLSVASTTGLAVVDNWQVNITGPGGSQSRSGASGTTVTFSELPPGTYSVRLEGFESGELVQQGQTSVTVSAGATSSAVVPVTPVLSVVTIVATDAAAAEAGPDVGVFTVTRTGGSVSAPLTVALAVSGTASSGVDYQTLSFTNIGAGQRSAALTVVPRLDTTIEGTETVVVSVQGFSGYTVGGSASATVSIADAPVVIVQSTIPNASEVGPVSGRFIISRTGNSSSALTVTLNVSGTANGGADYDALPSVLTLSAGQASVQLAVTPIADANSTEGAETVVLTVASSASYAVGTPNTATVTIADTPTVVSILAIDASASEVGPDDGTFRITRTGPTSAALVVTLGISGTASGGIDYVAMANPQTIPAGQASVDVQVTPIPDANSTEGAETVVLTVAPSASYAVGTPNTATVTIADTPTVVSILAIDASASEVGPDDGTFRITRTGPTSAALVVTLGISGTASGGIDYVAMANPQTIPAGQASVDVQVTPIPDASTTEGAETVVLTVAPSASYAVGTPNTATVTIADTPTVVSILAIDASASEVGPDDGTFRITRTGPTSAALAVTVGISGSASSGIDYVGIANTQTIAAGQAFVDVQVTPIPDANSAEGPETVVLTVASSENYAVGAQNSETVTIGDAFGPNPGGTIPLSSFTYIPSGSFKMGSTNGDADEQPEHVVAITRPFYLQKTEVTQQEWLRVMGSNPSSFQACGPLCPVERVSWDDVQQFIALLNQANPGITYRLPTEAEWEYAARATGTGDYSGNGVLNNMGWWSGNAGGTTHPVAQKLPNAWGLYDMHGNVYEWVQDWYSGSYYSVSPPQDPPGPTNGSSRVLRGGSWSDAAAYARSASRIFDAQTLRYYNVGFRLARNP